MLYNWFVITVYLQSSHDAARVHARCHINRITPYIVLGLLGANHSCNYGSMIQSDAQAETLKRFSINRIQYGHQSNCELNQYDHIVLLSTFFVLQQSNRKRERGNKSYISWLLGFPLCSYSPFSLFAFIGLVKRRESPIERVPPKLWLIPAQWQPSFGVPLCKGSLFDLTAGSTHNSPHFPLAPFSMIPKFN